MRLSRLRIVSSAVIPLLFLSACGSSDDKPPSALDGVKVGGPANAPMPTLAAKPLALKETTTKVVTPGKGAKLSAANSVLFNYALVNAKDGKPIVSNFGERAQGVFLSSEKLMPGVIKGLIGQQIGSRVLVGIPPAEAFGPEGNTRAGVAPTDSVVFLIDVVSSGTVLPAAKGTAVPPKAGLPTVVVDGAKAAQIKVPKTAAPKKLIAQPLIKGSGPVVKAGQTIMVNYTGVLWKNGKKFDASGDRGKPFDTPIGAGAVVPGWDKALVGKTVGSRYLLVVPPAEGYGAKGQPPVIGPKDTLVFVVDILAAT